MKKALPPLTVILRQSDGWLNAAIFQGARLMRLIDAQAAAGDASTWTEDARQAFNAANGLGDDHLVEDYEGYFFLCAVRQTRRWFEIVKVACPSLKDAVEEFETATAHAVDLRDMREHEDEYLAGGGKKSAEYLYTYGSPPLFETSAHSIVVHGDDYVLGGRLSLARALAALRKVQPAVERARRQFATTT